MPSSTPFSSVRVRAPSEPQQVRTRCSLCVVFSREHSQKNRASAYKTTSLVSLLPAHASSHPPSDTTTTTGIHHVRERGPGHRQQHQHARPEGAGLLHDVHRPQQRRHRGRARGVQRHHGLPANGMHIPCHPLSTTSFLLLRINQSRCVHPQLVRAVRLRDAYALSPLSCTFFLSSLAYVYDQPRCATTATNGHMLCKRRGPLKSTVTADRMQMLRTH